MKTVPKKIYQKYNLGCEMWVISARIVYKKGCRVAGRNFYSAGYLCYAADRNDLQNRFTVAGLQVGIFTPQVICAMLLTETICKIVLQLQGCRSESLLRRLFVLCCGQKRFAKSFYSFT
ncbi:MAG: hypothetical protein GY795_01420 [Desulfobacterales bacterium]|nr:hypothetical protein [Desulfobacterales bacterium]